VILRLFQFATIANASQGVEEIVRNSGGTGNAGHPSSEWLYACCIGDSRTKFWIHHNCRQCARTRL